MAWNRHVYRAVLDELTDVAARERIVAGDSLAA
jgi:hypothetical protein